ncbi:hypothetical protein SUGI_0498830 [Cryptomeria japonica]|uniref:uncharacterized protein LOC131056295 n=1 Tax=Cryptomeria japonica TaxID=3369 RepID=UPI002408EE39|nr:uncharacterized protein LOC131056295 [Cryptomeria japonica]GLJ26005.1 hypothetical protein SUGI_0498830 [Cryptomeria japonica]
MGSKEVDIEAMVRREGGGGGDERILSIVLSTSELAKLDLSNIQLFQANEAESNGHNEGIYLNSGSGPFPILAGPAGLPDPVVFKSRAVMEAENTRVSDYSGSPPGCRPRRPPPMAGISRNKNQTAVPLPEPPQVSKPRIDLKSSPASKFLAQIMPWELQPSPITPFTPAAVPFEWEEAPGRPKPWAPDRRSPRPLLHLPPRLLPRKGLNGVAVECPSSELGTHHRRPGSSGSADEKRVISIGPGDPPPVGCVLSCLDCDLPSPRNSNRASALITMRRKNSCSKQNRNSSSKSNKQKGLNPGGEFLIQKEDHELWVFEEAKSKEAGNRYRSLNGMIAAAMGAQTEDLDLSQSGRDLYSKNVKPSPIMNPQFYCPKMPRRTKRKWVLRKLRRPARFFKSFFMSVWRSVWLRKSRHNSIGNLKHSYQSLRR